MSDSNVSVCKVCDTNPTVVFVSDPTIKYDICMMCYFVEVNKNSNNTPPQNNKFELVKSE